MTNISERQNEPENIKKLKAQGQMYSDVKFLMVLTIVIGVGIPVTASFSIFALGNYNLPNPVSFGKNYITHISAVIGLLSAIGVLIINNFLKSLKEDAAKVQEMFDTRVFNLPWDNTNVGKKPDTGLIFRKSKKFDKRNSDYTSLS